jgi:hypothetical protein
MDRSRKESGIIRREFLGWLCKIGGGCSAVTLGGGVIPLRKINTVFLSEAHAQAVCDVDTCSTADAGGECTTRDVCDEDSSLQCTNDECTADSSGACNNDTCESDKSDSSKGCTTDNCLADSSGECLGDSCSSDSSGVCEQDVCQSDASGGCKGDNCVSDASGPCVGDQCASDSSGSCVTDSCVSDKSGSCKNDTCASDSSKGNVPDSCVEDLTPGTQVDRCISDSSAACLLSDTCTADASDVCSVSDSCVRDVSGACTSDLCRDDQGGPCTTDTCALDLASNMQTSRRQFAKAGINQALKMLYKLASVVLFVSLFYGQARAEINAADAAFSPLPTFVTSGAVSVPNPVGPFLRDCDHDGILEADVNGDGDCTGDPEVRDYNSDGSRELPLATGFSGTFRFTCFYIPYDVAIIATGPLNVAASQEMAVFGAVRLPAGGSFACVNRIDLRTSGWLAESGSITFTTATAGPVITDPSADLSEGVPPVNFTSACAAGASQDPVAIPTIGEWGMLLLWALLAVSALWMIRRKGLRPS